MSRRSRRRWTSSGPGPSSSSGTAIPDRRATARDPKTDAEILRRLEAMGFEIRQDAQLTLFEELGGIIPPAR